MRGAKRRIARREPFRRAPVKLAPAGLEETVVDGLVNECMHKQELFGIGVQQCARDERLLIESRHIEQIGKRAAIEALAEHGSRLQRSLVHRRKPVQPGLNEALHRAWNGGAVTFGGVLQKLLEKERVSRRAIDTVLGDLPVSVRNDAAMRAASSACSGPRSIAMSGVFPARARQP